MSWDEKLEDALNKKEDQYNELLDALGLTFDRSHKHALKTIEHLVKLAQDDAERFR